MTMRTHIRRHIESGKGVIAISLVLLTRRMGSESLETVWHLHDLFEKSGSGLLYRVKVHPWDKRL